MCQSCPERVFTLGPLYCPLPLSRTEEQRSPALPAPRLPPMAYMRSGSEKKPVLNMKASGNGRGPIGTGVLMFLSSQVWWTVRTSP